MAYREDKPASGDLLSDFPSMLTANVIAFRQAVEKHSFWTDSSGASAGIPRLSNGSFGPGSARAFFDVASNASVTLAASKPLDGRLYIASDTKYLSGYTSSSQTILLGSPKAIVYFPSNATITAGSRVLVQIGLVSVSSQTQNVTFGTQYSVTPMVQVSPLASGAAEIVVPQVTSRTSSAFSVRVLSVFGGSTATRNAMWCSIGTVVL